MRTKSQLQYRIFCDRCGDTYGAVVRNGMRCHCEIEPPIKIAAVNEPPKEMRYTSKLTNGKLMHLILPTDMSAKDFELLRRYIDLHEQAAGGDVR